MSYIDNHNYASSPYMQFIDRNGKPLVNGTLTTYIAGTSEPIATYKDWNKALNPSTITLDENGGCTMILDNRQRYKIIIKDANGGLFKTFDNVSAGGQDSDIWKYVDEKNQELLDEIQNEAEDRENADMQLQQQVDGKQNTLVAGDNIAIDSNSKISVDRRRKVTVTLPLKKTVNENEVNFSIDYDFSQIQKVEAANFYKSLLIDNTKTSMDFIFDNPATILYGSIYFRFNNITGNNHPLISVYNTAGNKLFDRYIEVMQQDYWSVTIPFVNMDIAKITMSYGDYFSTNSYCSISVAGIKVV